MTGLTWAKLVILGLAAGGAYGVSILAVDYVETRNSSEVSAALDAEGLDWAVAAPDGMRIVLGGTAPDEAARFRALTVAGRTANPAHVEDRMDVAEPEDMPALTYELEILRNGDSVLMHGLIPVGEDSGDDLVGRIRALMPGADISDIVTESMAPLPEGWRAAADLGLKALTGLPNVRVEITPAAVTVDGVALEGPAGAGWQARFLDGAPEGIEVAVSLRQPRERLSPFQLRVSNDGSGVVLETCAAESGADLDRIVEAVAAVDGIDDGTCRVALGAPDRHWAAAAEAAISALDGLGEGAITISDSTVTVLPGASIAPEALSAAGDALRQALPSGYRLSLMPVPSGDDAETGPRLSLSRSSEGPVTLRGPLSTQRDEAVLASLAAARFGADSLTRVISLSGDLPQGWDLRALAATEALALLDEGRVEMTPDAIAITGSSAAEDAARRITAELHRTLGQEAVFSVDVAYVAPPPEEEPGPSPRACVEAVNGILLDDKIDFEPGSVELGADGLETVDRIAEVLRGCPDVAMEIGGHTDSQGREEMNQLLSQARAEAVLSALAGRRVLTSQLTAKGYGESQPIADNGSEDGREANRRIAFRLVTGEEGAAGGAGAPAGEDADAAQEEAAPDGSN
ncbi:OmpA family protein [Poseidonocella sp. HB161398]|uniref:OmpA family protein n=1 Tax=Poseidonocella sp. HB161398 TaxID=2320855 RepID=UPI001108E933|nr:OmpA family protein [Poseidonocella sp. HB161398]